MYVGVKELKATKNFEDSWLFRVRRALRNSKWAVGLHRTEHDKIAIVCLDLRKVPWYEADSPIVVLMQNAQLDKHFPRLEKVLKKHPLPKGEYVIQSLGIDHSNLNNFKGDYFWGLHEGKIHSFQKKVDRGDFVIKTGSPCDTCVDEAQFMGCHGCTYNEFEDDYDYENMDDEEEKYYDSYHREEEVV